jgi:hypothetical protein
MPAQAVEHKSLSFEVKSVGGDGHGDFEGLGAVALNLDAHQDIIAPGAFKADLPYFLAHGFIGGLDHNWKTPIGHPAAAHETPEGHLLVKGVFDNTPEAQAVRALMTPNPTTGRATIGRLSIGYSAVESKRLRDEAEVKSYWSAAGYTPTETDLARARSGARLLTRLKLFEVSPVLQAANDLARITGAKSGESPGFAESSRKVATAARELSEAFGGYVDSALRRAGVRLKEGRVLSESNRAAIRGVLDEHRALAGEHGKLCDRLESVLERAMPPAKSGPETASVPDDAADITQRFIATFEALAGLD